LTAEAANRDGNRLIGELIGWQPFNEMRASAELSGKATSLLKLRVAPLKLEQEARKRGVSSGRLGWIRVEAKDRQSLATALVREAFVAFQHNEFDRFGVATRLKNRRWEALLLAERRAATIDGLPHRLKLGRALRSKARWVLPHEPEGLLSWHVQLPGGETMEGGCLSNGLCPIPTLTPDENGWMVVQLMVDRGMGPEVGFARHLLVGKADEVGVKPRVKRPSKLLGRQLLETMLNEIRKEAELPPLEFDGLLEEIATKKGEVIAQRRSFGHRVRGQRSAGAQLVEADIAFSRVVETIADGLNVEALVRQWLASPAHRAKILDPTLKRAGLGLIKPSKHHRSFTGVLLLTDELG
jgi:hypothetical protein